MLFDKKQTPQTQAQIMNNVEIIDETIDFNKYVASKLTNIVAEWKIVKEEAKNFCSKRENRLDRAQQVGEPPEEILSLTRELTQAETTLREVAKKYNEVVALKATMESTQTLLEAAREANVRVVESLSTLPKLDTNEGGEFN